MELRKQLTEMDKLINKFILRSTKFVEYACFPYGLLNLSLSHEKSESLTYDFEYFTFVKSTKTLISIRELLKKGCNEDVFILIRSIFENYLSCRYFNENSGKIDEFIFNPINIALANYNIGRDGIVLNRENEKVGEIENPTNFKLGSDKKYYYDYYDFLSRFAHCNFGIVECYTDKNGLYILDKVNYGMLARIFTIFTFTRVFEHVVTVEGEEFIDERTERACYRLVIESNAYLEEIIDEYISEHILSENLIRDEFKFRNKRVKNMLKNMKKSLKEELGSVSKKS